MFGESLIGDTFVSRRMDSSITQIILCNISCEFMERPTDIPIRDAGDPPPFP
jgi:hypothetical protein